LALRPSSCASFGKEIVVLGYTIRRVFASAIVLFVIVTGTFFLIQAAPGGLGILMNPELDPEVVAQIEANLGLDQPAHVQYARWMGNLLRGDMGTSLTYNRPVLTMVLERVPATMLLAGSALLISIVISIPLGVLCARNQHSWIDQLLSSLSFVGLAVPGFWLGILLVILFAARLRWLPAAGMMTTGEPFSYGDRLRHLVLPAAVLAVPIIAETMRFTRSSWLELLHSDFVRVARSKGLSEFSVQYRHILRNALIPIVTVVGLFLPRLVGGAAIVESLFSWPGMGSLAVDAATRRDAPLILGATILVSLGVIVSNLLIDLLYPALDPRLRGR
jgi:peptide/nickel transport system permease protein